MLYSLVLGSRYWKNEESIVFALEILPQNEEDRETFIKLEWKENLRAIKRGAGGAVGIQKRGKIRLKLQP